MPCPGCLERAAAGEGEPSYMMRVTRERLTEHRKKYPNGRLVITAPFQHRVFYDGAWPAPTRSFPLFQFRAYESPYEQMGGWDTLLYWSLQALMDSLRKQAYDQMVLSKPVLVVGTNADGKAALEDGNGNPFNFTNDADRVATYTGPPGTLQSSVWQFQGAGMPTSLPQLYSILSGSFYQTKGTPSMPAGPEQSKDVAFKSLLLQKESGDIPVDDHKQILAEEEGLFLGIVLDMWVHNSTDEKVVRYLGEDGRMQFQLLRGEDIPNVDVVVGAPPTMKQGAVEEIQNLIQWAQTPSPALRQILAKRLNLSPSEVAAVEQEMAMQMAPPPGMGGGQMNGQVPPDMASAFGGAPPAGMQ